MATKHWRLVLNGKVAGDAPLREAVALMRADGVVVDVRVTWECGDVKHFITDAIKDGVDSVIAAGGDGTFSEVAGALAARVDDGDALPTIGLIPLGTANDFAGAAQLPIDPLAAMRFGDPWSALERWHRRGVGEGRDSSATTRGRNPCAAAIWLHPRRRSCQGGVTAGRVPARASANASSPRLPAIKK